MLASQASLFNKWDCFAAVRLTTAFNSYGIAPTNDNAYNASLYFG